MLSLKPNIQVIRIADLAVDPRYQRSTEDPRAKTLLRKMENSWRWDLCGLLVVSRRSNGVMVIIDGQLRWTAAGRLGIAELPAIVHEALTLDQEAELYALLGTDRRGIVPVDLFKARVTAGDPVSVVINKILADRGLKVGRLSQTHDGNTINAITQLYSLQRKFGATHLAYTLDEIRNIWQGSRGSWHGRFIVGMSFFLQYWGDDRYTDEVRYRLRSITPDLILSQAVAVHAGDTRAGKAIAVRLKDISKIRGRARQPERLGPWAARE